MRITGLANVSTGHLTGAELAAIDALLMVLATHDVRSTTTASPSSLIRAAFSLTPAWCSTTKSQARSPLLSGRSCRQRNVKAATGSCSIATNRNEGSPRLSS